MATSRKEIKQKYYQKVYEQANWIECACGCETKIKDRDKYGRPKNYINGHNTLRKYEDPTQFKREWNHRNRAQRMEYKKQYHRKRKVKLVLLKGGKCISCGIEYDGKNACIFHFHHRDPSTKLFTMHLITVKSWDSIIEEVNKCDLLCANCHEKKHSEEF